MNKKHTAHLRLSALLLLIAIAVTSLSACSRKKGEYSNDIYVTRDSVVVKLAEDNDIPAFDTTEFANVEICFNTYYYTSLPDNDTLATGTKAAFFEYFPDVDKTDKAAVTHALIDCYIYSVGDSYAYYRTPDEFEDYNTDMSGQFVGIGVSVLSNTLENTILVTGIEPDSPALAAGIKAGDYIVAVNGELVSELGVSEALDKVKGEIGTPVSVTVKRGETEITFDMIRALISETFVTYKFIENTKIAYVRIKSFKGNDENNVSLQFREAIAFAENGGAEGIIFDVCANPGGYLSLVTDMISYLVPTGTLISTFSNLRAPIYAGNDGTDEDPTDHVLSIPCAVIFDESSASAAELFSGALRDYNLTGVLKSVSVGRVTFGKGIMQSTLTFRSGSALTLTTALYNTPLGTNFHGVGVTPDIEAGEDDDFIELAVSELQKLIADKNN